MPIILAQMRKYMIAQDALALEGIFRLAGNASEMQVIFCKRINLTTLIKVIN